MKTPYYNCSQAALYQVALNVYQSMANNLPAFTDFKSKYTQAYIDSLKDEITQAANIPHLRGRSGKAELEYVNLLNQLEVCSDLWQNLKRYIQAAYPEETHRIHIEQAGYSYYLKSVNKNWDAAVSLLMAANTYITENASSLQANNNMPASFITKFDTERVKFNNTLTSYQQLSEKLKEDTDFKIDSNNKVYDHVIEICVDGQQIFKNNEAKSDQFVFTKVLQIVSGTGTSGFKGYVFDAKTNQPLSGVSVTSTGFTKAVVTDENGFYEMLQIAEGKYPIAFAIAGYITHTLADYAVDSGVVHNLNINLTPMGS